MVVVGFECRLGERGFGTYGLVDPLGLRRLDFVLPSSGKEAGFVGRYSDRLDYQWPIEEFHDFRYSPDVRFRVLYRCHRRPCDLWFVLVSLPGFPFITETSIRRFHRWTHRPETRQPRHHINRETRRCGLHHIFAPCTRFEPSCESCQAHLPDSTSHFLVFRLISVYSTLASLGGTRSPFVLRLTSENSADALLQHGLLGSTGVNLQLSDP